MLGYLIYETTELTFYTLKLGYNGISAAYSWYYQENEIDHKKILIDKITHLEKELNDIKKKLNNQSHDDSIAQ